MISGDCSQDNGVTLMKMMETMTLHQIIAAELEFQQPRR